ncbi:MAG: hypothetical protein MGG11_17765 [Trichodesmium sp. MAG_R03]|nr:hypothetical protein [Trichodesmium sp. MAG_R03]
MGDNLENFYWDRQKNRVENLESLYRWQPTPQVCLCCGFRGGKLDLSGAIMEMP